MRREHVFAIGGDRARREAARPLVRHVGRPGRDGDAGRQTLDVDGEIDARQRLVEIVDVEEDGVFGRIERAEVHQMTVAAGLHRRAGDRLMGEIGRHHGRRAAQKPERVRHHALVALRQKRGHPLGVGLRKDGDGVSIPRTVQLRMGFARRADSQRPAVLVSIGAIVQSSGHGEDPRRRGGVRRRSARRTAPRLTSSMGPREVPGPEQASPPIAAQCSVGSAHRPVAGFSQAPVLILTAPYAVAPSVAMTVRTAAAQGESGANR